MAAAKRQSEKWARICQESADRAEKEMLESKVIAVSTVDVRDVAGHFDKLGRTPEGLRLLVASGASVGELVAELQRRRTAREAGGAAPRDADEAAREATWLTGLKEMDSAATAAGAPPADAAAAATDAIAAESAAAEAPSTESPPADAPPAAPDAAPTVAVPAGAAEAPSAGEALSTAAEAPPRAPPRRRDVVDRALATARAARAAAAQASERADGALEVARAVRAAHSVAAYADDGRLTIRVVDCVDRASRTGSVARASFYRVKASHTVGRLLRAHAQSRGIDAEALRFEWRGRTVDEKKTLGALGLKDLDELSCILGKAGGAAAMLGRLFAPTRAAPKQSVLTGAASASGMPAGDRTVVNVRDATNGDALYVTEKGAAVSSLREAHAQKHGIAAGALSFRKRGGGAVAEDATVLDLGVPALVDAVYAPPAH